MRLNGSIHEYYAHELGWLRMGPVDEYGQRKGLRMGQYIWNRMGKLKASWPELFQSKSMAEVSRLVHEEFGVSDDR